VARRYLCHALSSGICLASTVRLTMTGTIELNGAWCPFTGEQVSEEGEPSTRSSTSCATAVARVRAMGQR